MDGSLYYIKERLQELQTLKCIKNVKYRLNYQIINQKFTVKYPNSKARHDIMRLS